jgi:hypothetical protein
VVARSNVGAVPDGDLIQAAIQILLSGKDSPTDVMSIPPEQALLPSDDGKIQLEKRMDELRQEFAQAEKDNDIENDKDASEIAQLELEMQLLQQKMVLSSALQV